MISFFGENVFFEAYDNLFIVESLTSHGNDHSLLRKNQQENYVCYERNIRKKAKERAHVFSDSI